MNQELEKALLRELFNKLESSHCVTSDGAKCMFTELCMELSYKNDTSVCDILNKLIKEINEDEVNWNEVEFGTPVLVKDYKDDEWIEAKFLDYDEDYDFKFKAYTPKVMSVTWKLCKLKKED